MYMFEVKQFEYNITVVNFHFLLSLIRIFMLKNVLFYKGPHLYSRQQQLLYNKHFQSFRQCLLLRGYTVLH